MHCGVGKAQILFEGHKVVPKIKWPLFFEIFVAFSEYLNFN